MQLLSPNIMACSVRFHSVFRKGRFYLAGVVAACLGLSGCVNPPPEKTAAGASQNDLSTMARQLRPADTDSRPAGWSSKANEVERDLGVAAP
jgi:hypothetical protein